MMLDLTGYADRLLSVQQLGQYLKLIDKLRKGVVEFGGEMMHCYICPGSDDLAIHVRFGVDDEAFSQVSRWVQHLIDHFTADRLSFNVGVKGNIEGDVKPALVIEAIIHRGSRQRMTSTRR